MKKNEKMQIISGCESIILPVLKLLKMLYCNTSLVI